MKKPAPYILTRNDKKILSIMREKNGFIWYVDGKAKGYNGQMWQYPALCYGQTMQRIRRITLQRLLDSGAIRPDTRERDHPTTAEAFILNEKI